MNEVLDEQSRLSLVRYRIERADETIIEAKLLAGDCHYNAAMNAQLLCLQHEELPLSVEGVLKKVSF